jgi:hypothetical protein
MLEKGILWITLFLNFCAFKIISCMVSALAYILEPLFSEATGMSF